MDARCPEIPDILTLMRKRLYLGGDVVKPKTIKRPPSLVPPRNVDRHQELRTLQSLDLSEGLSTAQVRRNLKMIVPKPSISEYYVLPNGQEVGKFCVRYLLNADLKAMTRRRRVAKK